MFVGVFGNISAIEVLAAIKTSFPDKAISLSENFSAKLLQTDGSVSPTAVVAALEKAEVVPQETQHKLNHEIAILKKKLESSETSLKAAREKHDELLDEFSTLRRRYDDVKQNLTTILWTHCAKHHPDLGSIPTMEDDEFIETDQQVGELKVGNALGEGQFACVYNCSKNGSSTPYALKVISKDRIASFKSLSRISNEVAHLSQLKSPYIVSIVQAHHTESKLYILTEKGGMDLFDFFDEHQDGVSESDAKLIFSSVLKGVMYCHEHNVCHRDLKPENILLTYDPSKRSISHVKLCDFGLSCKFTHTALLTDFCGSPGFFAPEMIIHGAYYGDKADIWSLGCILLELMLGHERFCDIWMTAYDYDVLQDRGVFSGSIQESVDSLPSALAFSPDLNDFIVNFLQLHSSRRSAIKDLCSHAWLGHLMADEVAAINSRRAEEMQRSLSPKQPSTRMKRVESISLMDLGQIGIHKQDTAVNHDLIKSVYENMSEKERRQMEDYIMHQREKRAAGGCSGTEFVSPRGEMHLPPIEPQTPAMGKGGNRKKFFESPTAPYGSMDSSGSSVGAGLAVSLSRSFSGESSIPSSPAVSREATPPPTTSSKKHTPNLAVVNELSGSFERSDFVVSNSAPATCSSATGSSRTTIGSREMTPTNGRLSALPLSPRLPKSSPRSSSSEGGIAAFSPDRGGGDSISHHTPVSRLSADFQLDVPRRLSGQMTLVDLGSASGAPSRRTSGNIAGEESLSRRSSGQVCTTDNILSGPPKRPSGLVNSTSESSIFSVSERPGDEA